MPELMTKQDAIEYLLYMKHDVQAKSPMDIALDTAIEALKQPTIEAEPVRHGRWIEETDPDENGNVISMCNQCYHTDEHCKNIKIPYCWYCGARMDGGADNG